MKTITLNIDDDIFDKFLVLLDLLPNNKIRVFDKFLDDEEQKEIEKILENPECHEFSGYEKILHL